MTVLTGKLQSIGGKPWGGPGHFVVIFSRLTRPGPEGTVILELRDRIPMPTSNEGEFTSTDMTPGPIRVELEGGELHGQAWDLVLPETTEGDPPAELADLIDTQFEWTPGFVSRTEAAARRAEEASEKAVAAEEVVVAAESVVVAAERKVVPAAEQVAQDREVVEQKTEISTDASAAAIAAAGLINESLGGTKMYSGAGFPNGVVAAPVGSIYTDLEATAGAIRWIKTNGDGNTGWRVLDGDTGWRDVTSLYAGPHIILGEGAKLLIRRVNADILFKITGPVTANHTRANLFQLTSGWRPPSDTWVALGGAGEQVRHSTSWVSLETLTVGATIIGAGWSKEGRWAGRDEWPATRPGISG